MSNRTFTRRHFAVVSFGTIAAFALRSTTESGPSRPEQFPPSWPISAPTRITIAGSGEPGKRLIVTGHVFAADARTPVAGVMIYAYHTDANGLYRTDHRAPDGRTVLPRLQGIAMTDSEGRYGMQSILPAAYPNGRNPAHVHVKLRTRAGGSQEETIWFAGDPLLTTEMIARHARDDAFSSICALRSTDDATFRCVRDFRLSN